MWKVTELTDIKSIATYLNPFKHDEAMKNFKGSISSASETAGVSSPRRVNMGVTIKHCGYKSLLHGY